MKKFMLFFLCAALLFSLSGCENDSKETVSDTGFPASAATAAPPEIPETAPVLDCDNPVVVLHNEITDDPVLADYSYDIPQFNCSTEDARHINREIAEHYLEIVKEVRQSLRDGTSPGCEEISYQTFRSSPYLALMISARYGNDVVYYSVYNMGIGTGAAVSNQEILSYLGIGGRDFIHNACRSAQNCFDQKYGVDPDNLDDSFVLAQRLSTVSAENINPYMPMFMDENGQLMLISPVASLAGASSYEEVYPYLQKPNT